MKYEELLDEAYYIGIKVKELNLKGNNGRIKNKRIAIRNDIPTLIEKGCILAEELGHYYTTYGDILDQTDIRNKKQEYRARLWAYNKQIGLQGIIKAYESGCQNLFDMSEFLDVDERFLEEAIKCYSNKYGEFTILDNYIIYFIPNLGVLKLL